MENRRRPVIWRLPEGGARLLDLESKDLDLNLEVLSDPLNQLLTRDAFKVPAYTQVNKNVPLITLPTLDHYSIPVATYTKLYKNKLPLWGYLPELKAQEKSTNKSKANKQPEVPIVVNPEQYKEQFNQVINAIYNWGKSQINPESKEPLIPLDTLDELNKYKEKFFTKQFSGKQTPHYFITNKCNFEMIWFVLAQTENRSLDVKIAKLTFLCEQLGRCNSGVWSDVREVAHDLTNESSFVSALAVKRRQIMDTYAGLYCQLNAMNLVDEGDDAVYQQGIYEGSEKHVALEFYRYAMNPYGNEKKTEGMSWGPIIDPSEVDEQYGGQENTLIDDRVLVHFHNYFEQAFTPRVVLDMAHEHFMHEYNMHKKLLNIKEDDQGWIAYDQKFYDKTKELAEDMGFDRSDIFESREEPNSFRFKPHLFKENFLKSCKEKNLFFKADKWHSKTLAGDYKVHFFSNQFAWFETPDNQVLDWKSLPEVEAHSLANSFISGLSEVNPDAFRDYLPYFQNLLIKKIKTGADLVEILSSYTNERALQFLVKIILSPKKLKEMIKADPEFYTRLSALPAEDKWKRTLIFSLCDETFLFDAVRARDKVGLTLLADETKLSLDTKESALDKTLVHIAAKEGDDDIIRILAHHNANLNQQDLWADTPLHCAIQSGNLTAVAALLECKANVNIEATHSDSRRSNSSGLRPIQLAAKLGRTEIFKFLADKVDLHQVHPVKGNSLAHYAVENGFLSILQELIRNNVKVGVKNNEGNTPLAIAVKGKHWSCVEEIVKQNPSWESFLFLHDKVIPSIEPTLVDKLAEWKQNPNQLDSQGKTLAHVIVSAYSQTMELKKSPSANLIEALKKLANQNVDFHKPDSHGKSAFQLAAEAQRWDLVSVMLNLNVKGMYPPNKENLLFCAVETGNIAAIKKLATVVNINAPLNLGFNMVNQPILFIAIEQRLYAQNKAISIDVINALKESGADVLKLDDEFRERVATFAARKNDVEVVKFLQENKVDFLRRVHKEYRKTYIQIAWHHQAWDVVACLLKIEIQSAPGLQQPSWPERLVQKGDAATIKKLAEHKLDFDVPTLNLAFQNKRLDLVEIMLYAPPTSDSLPLVHRLILNDDARALVKLHECKVDLKASEAKFDAPMLFAAKHDKVDIMKKLMACGVSVDQKGIAEYAAEHNLINVMKLLAEEKINFTEKNGAGSPLRIAAKNANWRIVAIMLNLDSEDVNNGFSCAIAAVEKGDMQALQQLQKLGVDLRQKSMFDASLVDLAIQKNNVDMICMLAQQGENFGAILNNPQLAIEVLAKLSEQKNLNRNTLEHLYRSRPNLKVAAMSYIQKNKDSPHLLSSLKTSLLQKKSILAQVLGAPQDPRLFRFTLKKYAGERVTGSLLEVLKAIDRELANKTETKSSALRNNGFTRSP